METSKVNVVAIHKKNKKQCVKNYRPVSILPICSKVLECIIYNTMFTCFIENNLISENQSGFKPGDSCINQLLAIAHEIFTCFDNYEDRGVFLDISKAFNKVWHEGIIHKLKRNRIPGNLLRLLTDFLKNRKQRVILNDQSSSWANINAGVPQGSILGLLLFLIYINDLSDNLHCNPNFFAADDTSLFSTTKVPKRTANSLNNNPEKINRWAFQWKMCFNPDPTKQAQEVTFCRKPTKKIHPQIFLNNIPDSKANSQKHLGLHLNSKLSFDIHIKTILTKINGTIGLLRKFQQVLT